MNSIDVKAKLLNAIEEAQENGASLMAICRFLGISKRTIQRWKKNQGNLQDKRKGSSRSVLHKLTLEEYQQVIRICSSKKYVNMYPHEIVADMATNGEYIASESTFYRILKTESMLSHRRNSKPPKERPKPVLVANGPDEVYSWDITWLKTDVAGIYYYLYMVIDIWSRMIIHWEVNAKESGKLAGGMLQKIRAKKDLEGVFLHSDNSNVMKGYTMLEKMYQLKVLPSFSRPRVSEDNPYSESLFRTLKYRPFYPGRFSNIEEARDWVKGFVYWYNREHLHSSIQFVTPHDRHYGRDIEILEARKSTYREAYAKNPARWSKGPKLWKHEKVVGINYQPDKVKSQLAS
jgi:transposase InsO family protein